MTKIFLIVPALFLLAANPVAAQRRSEFLTPIRPATPRIVAAADTMLPRTSADREHGILIRMGTGALGLVAGGALGGGAGALLADDDGVSDEGNFGEVLLGGLIGGVVGAGIGAAMPDLDSRCTRSTRMLRGFVGSLAGGALSLLVLSAGESENVATPVLLVVPAFGAGVAAEC